jgi:hypothetical protein
MLLTSLTDRRGFRTADIVSCYEDRWRIETSYHELKQTMLGMELTLRSQTVESVYQEFWGALIVALLSRGGGAHAAGRCSSDLLKGAYAFSAEGEVLGILDDTGVVHPFNRPSPLNDVAILTFDGVGHFQRTDFGNINGVPKTSDFNSAQSGDYTVDSNCTGTMTIKYPSGVELDLKMVIAGDGTVVKALIGTEIVPSSTSAKDNFPCDKGCRQAVQVSFDGKKVFVSRERHQ